MTEPDLPEWGDLDTDTPNPARMYDYMLGGAANFAADRAAVRRMLELDAGVSLQAQANRAFLRRAVRYLTVEQGVRQFLDLGSGIPTVGNVHEIAQRSAPGARVVYVDNETVAVHYSRQVLATVPDAMMVDADVRDVDGVVSAAGRLLDFDEPVAVLLSAVLHFVLDDQQVEELVTGYRDRTAPGSWLVLSHGCGDDNPILATVQEAYRSTSLPGKLRSRAAITALFDGYQLVEPGIVYVQDWRSDQDHGSQVELAGLGGVGRKR